MLSPALALLAQAAAPQPPNMLGQFLVPVVCFGVIFYFLILRPQNKRQSDLQKLVTSLKTGDKVVTSGGIHGIVANVKDGTTLTLKVADNVKIEVDKSAIATVDRGPSAGAATPATTTAPAALAVKNSA